MEWLPGTKITLVHSNVFSMVWFNYCALLMSMGVKAESEFKRLGNIYVSISYPHHPYEYIIMRNT